jgi:hypothetical protein
MFGVDLGLRVALSMEGNKSGNKRVMMPILRGIVWTSNTKLRNVLCWTMLHRCFRCYHKKKQNNETIAYFSC